MRLDFWKLLSYSRAETMVALAARLGVSRQTVYEWSYIGVPEPSADRIAVKVFGVHPCCIWPEWFATSLAHVDPVSREAA